VTRVLDAAMEYAARGWPVFPLHTPLTMGTKTGPDRATCSCRDYGCGRGEHCENQGKHPRTGRGLHDASIDPEQIRGWWDRWPDANIGIRTGIAFDAIDVDGPDAEGNLGDHDESIDGPTVATGRGWHVWLQPTGFRNRAGFVAGCDWRGVGGYVVAPRSVHYSGGIYEWERPDHPAFGPNAPLQAGPAWLLNLLEPRTDPVAEVATGSPVAEFLSRASSDRYGQAALEGELGRLLMVPVGQRNDQLNRSSHALGQLVGAGVLDAGFVVDRLLEAAQRAGLGGIEAERTITSGLRAGMASPRRLTA
jgi:Bifunctional DNA primase/polymerase, N-terminal